MHRTGKGKAMAHNDTETAKQTYEGFISWTKWGTAAVAVVAVFVVILIS
jgi:hypothetical protein